MLTIREYGATFDNFLDVTAAEYVDAGSAEDAETARAALEAHYTALAEQRAKDAAKAKAKIALPDIDIASFAKKDG